MEIVSASTWLRTETTVRGCFGRTRATVSHTKSAVLDDELVWSLCVLTAMQKQQPPDNQNPHLRVDEAVAIQLVILQAVALKLEGMET